MRIDCERKTLRWTRSVILSKYEAYNTGGRQYRWEAIQMGDNTGGRQYRWEVIMNVSWVL